MRMTTALVAVVVFWRLTRVVIEPVQLVLRRAHRNTT